MHSRLICLLLVVGLLGGLGCEVEQSTRPSDANLVELTGAITEDRVLTADEDYLLTGQTFVKPGVTLTIEPGTTIQGLPYDRNGLASVLVVERGAKLIADGTADSPITFTTAFDDATLPRRGLWGGLILLGSAPINHGGGEDYIEGIAGIPFGGTNPEDNSGVLRYVRVWYGGRNIGEGNEINGITFGGVGSGTTVEHCEVAFNNDDGFEFFGGTVNVKHLSAIFCGDDCFDSDWGYQGKGQFLFALLGQDASGRGFEMDNDGGNMDAQPRSRPAFCNVTIVGSNGGSPDGDGGDQLMRLREGTGGDFRNLIALNGNGVGLRVSDDPTIAILTQTPDFGNTNALYFSPGNILFNCPDGVLHEDVDTLLTVREVDPLLTDVANPMGAINPLPQAGGPCFSNVEDPPDDPFFTTVDYVGAFGTTLWLEGWSWLDENGRLP